MLIPFSQLCDKYRFRPVGVLHLGANEGQEAEDYFRNGVEHVVWIEALPDIFAKLQDHIVKYRGHVAIQSCLSDRDGDKVVFHKASNGGQSSSFLDLGTHAQEHPTVRFIRDIPMITERVDTLLLERRIVVGPHWFLNVDLQGAELLAMRGMGTLLNLFDYAYIEVNVRRLYIGCPLVEDIDAFLGERRFVARECVMTGNGWGDKFYSRPDL